MKKYVKLFKKSQINQKESDYQKSKGDEGINIEIQNIKSSFHRDFLIKKAMTNDSIEAPRLNVKTQNFLSPFLFEKVGTIITAPNQPAERLTNKSETVDKKIGSSRINVKVTNYQSVVNVD